jgi:hypothetical protein
LSEYLQIESQSVRRGTLERLLPHLDAALLQSHVEKAPAEIQVELSNVRNTVYCLLVNSEPEAAPIHEEDWLAL